MTIMDYGGPAGVSVSLVDGLITDVLVGRPQKTIIVGRGDPANAQANANEPTPVQLQPNTEQLFGEGSELSAGLHNAIANGSQKYTEDQNGRTVNLLYGVMTEEVSVVDEQVTGNQATLQHAPIIEDIETIEVERASDQTLMQVEWRYEQPPDQPQGPDTVFVNAQEGMLVTPDGGDYNVSYKYAEWDAAMRAARNVVDPLETGMWGVLSEAESVSQSLSDWMDTLRPPYQMVRGVAGAQPNKTGDNGQPLIDTEKYTDSVANDAVWLPGNVRRPNGRTVVGGITGMMAGHDLTNPIFGDVIQNYPGGVVQKLQPQEKNDLRKKGVAPIGFDRDQITLADSNSTYEYGTDANYLEPETLDTWVRDFHRRRIIDQVILMGRAAGEFGLKRKLNDDTLDLVEQQFIDDIKTFISAGLLAGGGEGTGSGGRADAPSNVAQTPQSAGGQDNESYSVNAIALGTDTLGIAASVTPTGVVKHAEVRISIAKQSTTTFAEAAQQDQQQSGTGTP